MKLRRYLWIIVGATISLATRLGLAGPLPTTWRGALRDVVLRSLKTFSPVNTSVPHEILGHRMFLHPVTENAQAMVFGTYEKETVKLFQRICRHGMNVVDAGASIGFYTLLAAKLVATQGRVYAFEPDPESYTLLLENVRSNGYQRIVHACPKAISDVSDFAELFRGTRDSGENSFYPGPRVGPEESVVVETTTLDEFLKTETWPSIDLVKMDVEGAESLALSGMKEVARRNPDIRQLIRSCERSWRFVNLLCVMGTRA